MQRLSMPHRLVGLVPALLLAVLLPAAALAHAQLRSAEPPAHSVVAAAPSAVVLTFNEPVAVLSVVWTGPDGAAAAAPARTEGARLIVTVPEDAARGTHVLSWRVVSDDGHPVGGAHVFSIGAATAAMAAEASAAAARLAAAGRAALTLTLAFGVGALAAAALFRAPAAAAARWLAWGIMPASLLLLAGTAADLAGRMDAAVAPAAWAALAGSPFLASVVLALAALAMASAGGRWLAAGALAAGGLSFAVAGHAGTAAVWAAPVVALHAALAMLWAGTLVVLTTRAGRDAALVRFGRVAPAMVAGLVGAGAALSWVQLDPALRGWQVVWTTGYGQVLAAKIALAALILGLAALNRWRLAPAAAAGRPAGFARSLGAEIALMVLLLALTGAFRLTPPPRAMAEPAVAAHVHGRLSGGDLRLIPGRPGANRIEIAPHDADFGPLDPREIAVSLTHPATGTGPVEAVLRPVGGGLWQGEAVLPAAGAWEAVVRILIDDFTQERLGAALTLP
ncbi:MAG: copper resistance protein CopC [Gemmobacter sp.]